MKQIGKLTMMLFALLLWTGCSEETTQGDDDKTPQPDENTLPPREVMFTLNNELKLMKGTTKAGGDTPVATAEENAIASLDVFVFGCATEEGDYTFQEMFSYRADDAADLPLGATALELTPTDDTNKQTKGLLKLKKGLFVKLYCIANCTSLTDPAGDPVDYTDFVPLVFTQPGEAGTTVATEGLPTETQFTSYHTPLLKAGKADDILLTPLAMSGAYTIPLDLTDFSTSTQLQIGFKLTRVAARFDIINKADESRFTIREVSMGNGRRGSTFFPIRIYGDTPTAQDGELITYPARPFDGENANTGTQTGAFYSYPSLAEDNGFIILKGTYQTNKTDQQEVSYQIPFTQTDTDGNTTILEINNNHRYTIAITEADDYHLDFTLTVADWTDSGDIDDYEPGKDGKSTVEIKIPDAFQGKTYYTEQTRTVSMYIKDGDLGEKSTFDITARSSMPLTLRSSYAGSMGTKEYDWLKVGKLLQKVSNTAYYEYTCHLSLQDGYDKKRYPKVVLRFMNLFDGSESVVLVDAQSAPSTNETPQPNGSHNSFDPMTSTATLYKTDNSTVVIKLTCADGVKVKSQPDWLDLTNTQQSDIETTYTFQLNDRTTTETEGTIVFCNIKEEDWETPVTVKLLDASSNPVFENVGGASKNEQTGSFSTNDANINMSLINENTFTVKTSSLDGVGVEIAYENGTSDPKWLTCTGASSLKSTISNNLVFKLNQTELAKGVATQATVTLKNISGGGDETFTITPVFIAPTVAVVTSSANPTENSFDNSSSTISLYKVSNSSIKINASSLGGNVAKEQTGVIVTKSTDTYATDNEYTVTWDNSMTSGCSFKLANKSDDTKETTVNVTLLDATITPVFSDASGGNSCNEQNITMKLVDNSSFKLKTTSVSGVNPEITYPSGGAAWLTSTGGTKAASTSNELVFSFNKKSLTSGVAQVATITLKNLIAGGKDIVYTVTPEYQAPTLTTATSMNMQVNNAINDLPTITISGKCIGGSTIEGPDWLTYTPTNSGNAEAFSYTVTINPNSSTLPTTSPDYQTITVKNKADAGKTTTVTVNITETTARQGTITSYTENLGSDSYRISTNGGTLQITAYGMFVAPTATYSYDGTYCNATNSGNSWLQSATSTYTIVNSRRQYTLSIPVKNASGTDAAYQLHKASITVKHNGSTLKSYTIWRGASTTGYKVNTAQSSGSPYYTALKKGSYWWAPVNLGATVVATSANTANANGNLYQWGRRDETNLGSSTKKEIVSTSTPDNHVFYLNDDGSNNYDWLNPGDGTLWNGTSKGKNDPCPSGWRVPTVTELSSLGTASVSNGVIKINSNTDFPQIVMPACGWRTRQTGNASEAGSAAYSWTSTIDNVRSKCYKIGIGQEISARTNAYPIRCIKQ